MIKSKKHCNYKDCKNPIWSKGRCKWHPVEKPAKINPVAKTDKNLEALSKYRSERDLFLKQNPICMIDGCTGKSTLHHAKGRIGKLLYDRKYFRNLCWKHHSYAETHPQWAYENGYSVLRTN